MRFSEPGPLKMEDGGWSFHVRMVRSDPECHGLYLFAKSDGEERPEGSRGDCIVEDGERVEEVTIEMDESCVEESFAASSDCLICLSSSTISCVPEGEGEGDGEAEAEGDRLFLKIASAFEVESEAEGDGEAEGSGPAGVTSMRCAPPEFWAFADFKASMPCLIPRKLSSIADA